jgi:hypothetical protein
VNFLFPQEFKSPHKTEETGALGRFLQVVGELYLTRIKKKKTKDQKVLTLSSKHLGTLVM